MLRRSNGDGVLSLLEIQSLEGEEGLLEFHLVPLFLTETSTISALLLEICEFCVTTGQGSLRPSEDGSAPTLNIVTDDALQIQSTVINYSEA